MITYGFYDSKNHDRRYNSIQFGSIFDGIIKDGVFMSIGNCFRVIPGEGMMVLVGTGRCWFNHTWTLNDAPLPITVPQSELILNRIDAIVLEVDGTQTIRRNRVIIIKGTPSSKPQRPALTNTTTKHQYPIAYISVNANVTSIRTADITNMVGTSSTPYVTGILETVNIDALLDQWEDQWKAFFEKQSIDMENTTDFWKREWQLWYEAQTNEIQDAYLAWQEEWRMWSNNYQFRMEETAEKWENLWNAWFYMYVNENQLMISNWQQEKDEEYREWFESLKAMLDEDVAANLAEKIIDLQDQIKSLEKFKLDMITSHTIVDPLYGDSLVSYDNIIDSVKQNILDSDSDPLMGRNYGKDPILDNAGRQIETQVIFVVK